MSISSTWCRSASIARNATQIVQNTIDEASSRLKQKRPFDRAELSRLKSSVLRARSKAKSMPDAAVQSQAERKLDRLTVALQKASPKRGASIVALDEASRLVSKIITHRDQAQFGYPQAHEHDAERAVRAGLELVQAVTKSESEATLQTRVGIATGLVVVGDLIGAGEAQERNIVGETPNLAARLQGIAEPNSVVIAESTRKLLGNLFDLQEIGAQELKGIDILKTWAVLLSSLVESRFEALHASGLTELVGREEELELLIRRWSKSKTGEGQLVLLSGEAGIGKSRLTAALIEGIASEPHTRLRYFCSPQHTDSAVLSDHRPDGTSGAVCA